ncbi:TPA: hypothetical protein I8639_002642 [Serratia marcescens]|nr:hypothetical protein [Serratia marcescens]
MRKVSAVTDTADINGEFTEGNVAQGVPPTILKADIFNTWQRELVNVVEGSGLVLDPDNDRQVLEAIFSIVNGAENMIINGSFVVNQRNYSSGKVLSPGEYGHDRWKAGGSGCTYSYGTTPETVSIVSGTLVQVIEGANSLGGSITLTWSGTSKCRVNGSNYSTSPLTVNVLNAYGNINVEFNVGSVSRIQCSVGSFPFLFRRRSYGEELRLCQRYYQSSSIGTTSTFAQNGTDAHTHWFMKTTMRASPSVYLSGGNGDVYKVTPDFVDVKMTAGASNYASISNIILDAEI